MPSSRDGGEPDNHNRSEDAADTGGAFFLYQEDADQNEARERNDAGFERLGGDRQTFHRAQDGNGRGDHAVAVE